MDYEASKVFMFAFAVAAFAGLAALLRTGRPLTIKQTMSAMLNSGLLGLSESLLWYSYFKSHDGVYILIGICVLSGLAGVTAVDYISKIFKGGGVTIRIAPDKDDPTNTPKTS